MGFENSGRRPAPTALTVLRGNPSHKKLNENEPVPPCGNVQKPTLSVGAGAVWDELAPVCLAMGTLTLADVRVFVTLCELQAIFNEASSQKDGRALLTLKQDDPEDPKSDLVVVIDAVLKLQIATATALRPYYALFGLEPISRARMSVPKKDEAPKSKWAGQLK